MIAALAAVATLAVAFVTVASYSRDWRFALIAHFRALLAAGSWIVLVLVAVVPMSAPPKLLLLVAAFGAALVNLAEIVLRTPRGPAPTGQRRLRIVFANLLKYNRDATRLIDWVRREKPDMLVVAESIATWPERLSVLADEFPHIIRTRIGDVAIYSRHALTGEPQHFFPTVGHAIAVEVAGLGLVAVHTAAPEDEAVNAACNDLIDRVGSYVAGVQGPVAVVGDFNATPWCAPVIRLIKRTGLRYGPGARIGSFPIEVSGWRWPKWFALPIDLVLATKGAVVTARRHGPLIGSDHWPVIAEIAY